MIKKILLGLLLATGLWGQQLTNYPIIQWDTSANLPGYCTPPGLYYLTSPGALYVCKDHSFIKGQPTLQNLFEKTTTVTVANTAASQAVDLTADWSVGSASNTISITNLSLEQVR